MKSLLLYDKREQILNGSDSNTKLKTMDSDHDHSYSKIFGIFPRKILEFLQYFFQLTNLIYADTTHFCHNLCIKFLFHDSFNYVDGRISTRFNINKDLVKEA